MSVKVFDDERIRSVRWHDLAGLRPWETVKELVLPLPWLAASLLLAHRGLYAPALACSFLFYLAGLRQVHDAYHQNLGISRRAGNALMFALSVLMLGSMHVVRHNHLHHHRHCLDDEDVEGASARMSGWRALLLGPVFPVRQHAHALRAAKPRQRHWMAAELAANAAWIGFVFAVLRAPALCYHVVAMAAGQAFSAFFCVWTVHHGCDSSHRIARTLRSRLKSFLSMGMFFHLEHHLFPKVPTCRLPILAERLDRAAPELQEMQVF
ncbi:MAG: fatty acid desaturase [Planctomycetota bacterium]